MSDIGKRVVSLRTSRQISQRELASRCELSQPTIANIERGRTKEIKGFVLEALARELNTTTGFLLDGAQTPADHETTMMLMELSAVFKKMPMQEQETLMRMIRAMSQPAPKVSMAKIVFTKRTEKT